MLVNLGREDELDRDGLRRLVASINRYLGDPDAPAPEVTALVGDELTVAGSRPMGTTYLLDGLWRQLGIDTALSRVLDARQFTTDVERVLFALVANRAVDPLSKLAAAEWASEDVLIAGLAEMDEDQAYRAMDLLVDDDTQAKVQESVFFAVATCSTSRSTCCCSTPPAPTGSATPKTPKPTTAQPGSAGTAIPRTTARTCRRSSSAWR